MERTVIALYENLTTAQHVVEHLVREGFSRDRLSLIANDAQNEYSKYLKTDSTVAAEEDDVKAGEGAGFGAVVGALTGALVGLGALAIPGIGAALVAGPIIGGLTGAAAGAATGGIVAAIVKTGVPEEEAQYYAEGIRRGGTLLVVHTNDEQAEHAQEIMSRHDPVDLKQRGGEWQKSGWSGFDTTQTTPYSGEEFSRTQNVEGQAVLPVVEEEIRVGKREVERGGVRVFQHVTETPVEEQVTLRQERVNVERRAVDRPVTDADAAFQEGSFEVTAKSEEAIVSKDARVVEEVIIDKDVQEQTKTIRDTVRRTDVEVQQTDTDIDIDETKRKNKR